VREPVHAHTLPVKAAWIAVLALVLMMSGAAQARTTRQPVPTSIAFWDRSHGLASFVVYGPTDRSEGYVAVTEDGGKTWTIRWRGTAVWDVGVVRGTREAWAQVNPGRLCTDCKGVTLRTRDRGRTWRRAGTPPSSPSFATPQVGFAMNSRQTNAGDLMKTTNGGRTWRRAGTPCRKGWGGFALSASISFVSPTHGWVLCKGQPGAGSQSKALYVTRDGGARWKRLLNAFFEPGPVRLGTLRSGYAGGMSFTRGRHGLMWFARGQTLRTSDAGHHWRRIHATSPEEREAYSGWLVNDRIGYLLLQDSGRRSDWELLRTENGGRTWRLVRSWLRR
jgi:photosystem II stability/assembly factor-like uncharacterized protein